MQPLLDAILAYAPSPAERPFAATAKSVRQMSSPVAASDQAPAAVFVWKTIADPFAGRITMFRVISGVVKADSTVQNLSRDASERFGHLTLLQGKTPTNIAEVHAGDLAAVAKLKDTLTSDLLGDKSIPFRVAADQVPRTGDLVRDRTQVAAATKKRSARRCTGCRRKIRASATTATPRPSSCCSPGRGSRTSRSPSPS